MKRSLLISTICLSLGFGSFAQTGKDSVTLKEYQRATEFLSYNTYPKVKNARVSARWIDEDSFWYQADGENSEEYVLVNAKNGKKTNSFFQRSIA